MLKAFIVFWKFSFLINVWNLHICALIYFKHSSFLHMKQLSDENEQRNSMLLID